MFGWRLAVGAALLGGALASAAAACNSDDSSTPTGSGNDVTVDNDATMQPSQPTYDGNADSPFAPVDGGVYPVPDGYDPYGVCVKCACPATDYCFGGGGSYSSFSGNCNPTGFGIGCQPLPAGCSGDSDCDCLLQATAAQIPCYAVCVQGNRAVYCPNP